MTTIRWRFRGPAVACAAVLLLAALSASCAVRSHTAVDATRSVSPAPLASEPPLDPAAGILDAARQQEAAGDEALEAGDLVSARGEYDAALETLTDPAVDPDQDRRLLEAARRITEKLDDLDLRLASLARGESDARVPGAPLENSPLDKLAEPAPELSPEQAEQELARVTEKEPTFDLPVVHNEQVLAWVDFYSNRSHDQFLPGLVRSGRYLPMIRRVFQQEGLPLDLAYMAHVESAYKIRAYSRARAKGMFQFIYGTGRRYGLRIDYWVDERADPEKAARAAARYLKDLYAEFGDWYLALAAYNAGEGKVRRAIRKTGSRDFWTLARTRYLRRETRNYVPAILAATIISKQPEKYGFWVEPEPPLEYETIPVRGAADLRVLAKCAGTDVASLQTLNPSLRRNQTPPDGTMEVRVPSGRGAATLAALRKIPVRDRVLYARHKVRRGDTLSTIARRYGVTIRSIQQANRMGRHTLIREGRVLLVPTSAASGYRTASVSRSRRPSRNRRPVTYRVRRGDTLSGIARRYGTTARAVAAASGIRVRAVLHPGDRLTIPGTRNVVRSRRAASPRRTASGRTTVHTVRRGETLWGIAAAYRTTVDDICSLNSISRNAVLYPGTRLTVRRR